MMDRLRGPKRNPSSLVITQDARHEGAQIRWELVNRIREEIASGQYDTEEKLDAAIDRFLDQIEGGP
jgi:anti-sigma28 factor (negative regulator of flagellin synthesis)